MTKAVIRTGTVEDFFARAKDAALRADQRGKFSRTVTLSFEDPQRMFSVLSDARRRLMAEVMHEPKSISDLSQALNRHRASVTKDIGMLEKLGLLVAQRQVNPGHGIQKVVRSIAPRIEMMVTLG